MTSVIERIEKMYAGEYKKKSEPDYYDLEDSFIDDSDWVHIISKSFITNSKIELIASFFSLSYRTHTTEYLFKSSKDET